MSHLLTRRELLRAAALDVLAAGGLAVAARADERPIERRGPTKRVVVLGAGLAGLAAAWELTQAGHQVTVLEARDRPGGRVLTLREPFVDGQYAEAGALFIPDNHAATLRFVRLLDLPLSEVPPRAFAEMFYIRNTRAVLSNDRPEVWPLDLTPEERQLGYRGMWQKYVGDFLERMARLGSLSAPTWPPGSLKPLDQMSFADFLRRQGASPDAIALLRLGYFDLWGDGIDAVSALAILRDSALRLNERHVYSVHGGNDRLPKALADKLKESIRYGCPATRIEHGPDGVAVTYTQAGAPARLTADYLVCAIPFTTLRRVTVTPAFSPEKQRAIAELPYTSVARVFLQTRRRFWRDEGLPGMANTDLPVMWLWEPTWGQTGTRGILESYATGAAAWRVTAMREPDRLTFALEQMEKVYPGLRASYECGASKCWDEDEWSRGDYAWFRPGQVTALMPHIASADGRVHFAGEHTSAWPGWMQGALDSGVRAAREIVEAAG